MKKKLLVLCIALSLLVLIVSCKKKDDPNATAPVVVEAVEKKDSVTPVNSSSSVEEKKEETPVVSATSPVTEVKEEKSNDGRMVRKSYNSEALRFDCIFREESASIMIYKAKISDEDIRSIVSLVLEAEPSFKTIFTFSFADGSVSLTYAKDTPDKTLESFFSVLSAVVDEYGKKRVKNAEILGLPFSVEITEEKAEIAVPEAVTGEEIASFMAYLLENNPSLASKARYGVDGNVITLTYTSPTTLAEGESLWKELLDEVRLFLSSPVEEAVEEKAADTEIVEATVENKEEEKPVVKNTKTVVSPLTAAGRFVMEKSVSLSGSIKLDPEWGFDADFRALFSLEVVPGIRTGLSLGYECTGYIPLLAHVRYDLPFVDGMYVFGDGGWRFGFGGRTGNVVLGVGIGYEYPVMDTMLVFGEAELQIHFASKIKLMPSIAVGGRIIF